jgi:hypothetical protein
LSDGGQFTQPDPIGLAGGLNAYGFAGGDPISFRDPFGLCPEKPWECPDIKAEEPHVAANDKGLEAPLVDPVAIGTGGFAGAVRGWLARRAAQKGAEVTVAHYTSAEGAAAIEASGALRAGSYVTVPNAVSGQTARQVERTLEIQAGRAAMNATFRVRPDVLSVPANGPLTSGGAVQYQITQPIRIPLGTFVPTPP